MNGFGLGVPAVAIRHPRPGGDGDPGPPPDGFEYVTHLGRYVIFNNQYVIAEIPDA